jgi:hypothetical protein
MPDGNTKIHSHESAISPSSCFLPIDRAVYVWKSTRRKKKEEKQAAAHFTGAQLTVNGALARSRDPLHPEQNHSDCLLITQVTVP